jgi:ABC-2 type transport system permease protein
VSEPVPDALSPVVPSTSPKAWRVAGITPRGELLASGRIAGTAVRLVVQVFLVVCLWRALYHDTTASAGLDQDQAVTFAVLAALAVRMRGIDRSAARDTVLQQVQLGTIVYWFMRPVAPPRYYMYRAVGDQLYGFVWACAGYVVCRVFGLIQAPASADAAGAFAVSVVLGQMIFYYLALLIDLLCFWTVKNEAGLLILVFAQNLLSGVFAPLWYFPDWFRTMSAFLPFQATLNTPLSLYIGRIPPSSALRELGVQAVWVILLAGLSRLLWRRAADRVVSQGG